MATEWLNVFVDQTANSPATQWVDASDAVQVGNRTVRLFESDRSGAVVMNNGGIATIGDSEVYLKINFSNGTSRFLSAPLHTPVDIPNVASLEVHILFLTGPAGTPYRALVNGHCVYQII